MTEMTGREIEISPIQTLTFAAKRPPVTHVRMETPDGRCLLDIASDGTVTGEVEDASEAAAVFVREVRRMLAQP